MKPIYLARQLFILEATLMPKPNHILFQCILAFIHKIALEIRVIFIIVYLGLWRGSGKAPPINLVDEQT